MELYRDKNATPEARAADLISRMTLREKVGQLTQRPYGFRCYQRDGDTLTLTEELTGEIEKFGSIGALYGLFRADPWAKRDFNTGLDGRLARKAYNMVQEYVISHSRFGIPVLMATECPHGHQALDGYLLPVNLASAASFSPALVREAFSVCGEQMRETGIDLAYAAVMDVARDPRWGRCEECFGEDPRLASVMADAVVRGIRSADVDVVAKHFCAQGETTGGVNASAARIGMRELREIHLPPARAAIKAGAASVMATYNEIDGTFCLANRRLLRDILRDEWGFDGFVMSDALAVYSLDLLTGDRLKSVAMAFRAGVDMGLLDDAYGMLAEACEAGLVSEAEIDDAAARVLTLKFARGLFEHPLLPENAPEGRYTAAEYPIVRKLTEESLILLKNDGGLLPLDGSGSQKIGITGPSADNVYAQLGDYTPPVRDGSCVTFLRGMENFAAAHGMLSMPVYAPAPDMFETDAACLDATIDALKDCDIVFAAVGGSSSRFEGSRIAANGAVGASRGMDCGEGLDSGTLELPGVQTKLLRRLKEAGHTVIAVLIAGRPYAMREIEAYSDAIICAFYPGLYGGDALARLIFGEISPSGRLPISLPDTVGQLPVYYNWKQSYPAMKYCDAVRPKYSFGFGLSYSSMAYSVVCAPDADAPRLTLTVENTGTHIAHAVPMLFLRRKTGIGTARVRELAAFDKVMLKPGEHTELTLPIPPESFEQCDEAGNVSFVPGRFEWYLCDGGMSFAGGEFEI